MIEILDLYCSAGGAAMGFHQHFRDKCHITGVDWKPQKNFPFDFVQADALEYLEKNCPRQFHQHIQNILLDLFRYKGA